MAVQSVILGILGTLLSIILGTTVYYSINGSPGTQDLRFSEAINRGLVNSSQIPEGSGLAASQRNPGILYTHNDKGGENRVFALDANTAQLMATFTISGATNNDWEDIAVGKCGLDTCMYIGDVGDGGPKTKTIYRVKEPAEIRDQTLLVDSELLFRWPLKDCETLMVDPTEELYIASKTDDEPSWIAHIPTAGNWDTGIVVEVVPAAQFSRFSTKKNPVGGDISPDGKEVLIKFKEWVFYYKVADNETYADAIKRDPVELPYLKEPRGESVCWSNSADGYYTMSESEGEDQPLYFYQRQ